MEVEEIQNAVWIEQQKKGCAVMLKYVPCTHTAYLFLTTIALFLTTIAFLLCDGLYYVSF